nr:NHL repeat-containing protein [Paenibacillus bovis]
MWNWKRSVRSFLCFLIGAVALFSIDTQRAAAEGATDTYNYSFWGTTVKSPAAYTAEKIINGQQFDIGAFADPNDIHVTENQDIYVVDTGNQRIVILNKNLELVHVIDSFMNNGQEDTFNQPEGIFVNELNDIYIADTGNKRIVHLNDNYELEKIVDSPQSEVIKQDFDFKPVRVVVDKAQRIYVMASGVFDGFMEFNADGEFTTFIGANRVQVNPIEYLWKQLATKEQRSQMVQFIPTEFTNLDINEQGFIYATNGDSFGDTIKKLNAQGNDILRREGYFNPRGDENYYVDDGPSRLIDIDVWHSEIYSVLDSKRGRVFTYNGDGHLMYIFGGLGNLRGEFVNPIAIERLGNDFLVLDRALGEITVFEPTVYGTTLNEAVKAYYNGEEEDAYHLYQETINMNANLDFAYTGIGKALLRQGKYKEAMEYFKVSKDQMNYSKAFLLHRKQVLRGYFPYIMTGIVAFVLLWFGWKVFRNVRGGRRINAVD